MSELPQRGLFRPDGKPIISTPTPEQIVAINTHPKAEYFSTFGPNPEMILRWTTRFGLHRFSRLIEPFVKNGYYYFNRHVLHPLWEKVDSEFGLGPEHIAIRGTAAAVGLPVKLKNGVEVRSLLQILSEGSDTGSQRTRLATLSMSPGSPITYSRDHSGNYLNTWAWLFRRGVEEEGDDKRIFPLMLVYDTRNMEFGHHDVILPDDPKLRQNAILKAYIVDQLHSENTRRIK